MRLLPGVPGPLRDRSAADVDWVCVRENSEGEYAGLGGRLHRGTPHEVAEQTGLFTRRGIERVVRYACELAHVAAAAPAGQRHQVERPAALDGAVGRGGGRGGRRLPDARPSRRYHVDALAARMVTHPQTLDVMVASNLFGDILTDLGAAVSGSLGVAPGANLNPDAAAPVDVRADPRLGAGHRRQGHRQSDRRDLGGGADARPPRPGDARQSIVGAIEEVLAEGQVRTPDLGGTATTAEVTAAVIARLG